MNFTAFFRIAEKADPLSSISPPVSTTIFRCAAGTEFGAERIGAGGKIMGENLDSDPAVSV